MTREEALQAIKAKMDYYESDKRLRGAIETLIPELREDEDERIRKIIYNCVYECCDTGYLLKDDRDSVVAWLEKQQGQPTNEEMLRTLRAEYEKGVADTIAKYEQKEQKPAWSEKDREMIKGLKKAFNECLEKSSHYPKNAVKYWHDIDVNEIMSFLDSLETVKSTEWGEEDEQMFNTLVSYVEDPSCWKLKCPREKLVAFIESIPKRFSPRPKQEWSEDFEQNISNLLRNKLVWHSDDGSMSTAVFIDDKTMKDIVTGIWFYVAKEAMKHPNMELPMQEWSDEDEKMLADIIADIKGYDAYVGTILNNFDYHNKRIDWLKSLRPQPKWKPSKEQMEALNYAIAEWDGGKRLEGLYALRNDLKKLMEE